MPLRHLAIVVVWFCSALHAQGGLKTTNPLPPDLSRVRIKLERTGCFGFCPIYSVSIAGNGAIEYQGRGFVAVKGKQNGRVSLETVRRLVGLINSSDYFDLLSSYGDCGSDLAGAVVSIEGPAISKSVKDCGDVDGKTIPSTLKMLEAAIDVATNSNHWVLPLKDRIGR